MKLDRLTSGVCAAVVASLLACACSTSGQAKAKTPAELAALNDRVATTELMSAQVDGPAPKVGKSHLEADALDGEATTEELGAPKEARREDGSRRGGHFGTTK